MTNTSKSTGVALNTDDKATIRLNPITNTAMYFVGDSEVSREIFLDFTTAKLSNHTSGLESLIMYYGDKLTSYLGIDDDEYDHVAEHICDDCLNSKANEKLMS